MSKVVSDKLVFQAMKAIIDYYDRFPTHSIATDFLCNRNICDEEQSRDVWSYLLHEGLITIGGEHEDFPDTVRLTGKGKVYLTIADAQQRAQQQHEQEHARLERQYRKDSRRSWIQFWVTTTLSVIAIVLSVIAILSEAQVLPLKQLLGQ